MSTQSSSRIPSLVKKFLMALSGLVLVLFVLGHMLGNAQFFLGPEVINAYAYGLHNLPGSPFSIWGIRLFLLGSIGVHVWMAILLTLENRSARPDDYAARKNQAATYASRTMPMTGLILLSFIIFHILHYTTRIVPEPYNETIGMSAIEVGHAKIMAFDVYAMMVRGFSSPGVSLFYIIATGLLCMHLNHGVSSMFQSLGVRNESWRYRLNCAAKVFGWIIFLGFAAIPASVVLGGVGKDYLAEKLDEWKVEQSASSVISIMEDNK